MSKITNRSLGPSRARKAEIAQQNAKRVEQPWHIRRMEKEAIDCYLFWCATMGIQGDLKTLKQEFPNARTELSSMRENLPYYRMEDLHRWGLPDDPEAWLKERPEVTLQLLRMFKSEAPWAGSWWEVRNTILDEGWSGRESPEPIPYTEKDLDTFMIVRKQPELSLHEEFAKERQALIDDREYREQQARLKDAIQRKILTMKYPRDDWYVIDGRQYNYWARPRDGKPYDEPRGKSAYEVAVELGQFQGTEAEWLAKFAEPKVVREEPKSDPVRDCIVAVACVAVIGVVVGLILFAWR